MADDEEASSRKHPKRKITKKSYANGGAGSYSDDDDASHPGSDYESEFEESDDDESSQGSDEDWVGDDEEEPCIFDQLFHRIILDEAHTIRNSKTAYFASTNAIQATNKLCITGTPFIVSYYLIFICFCFLFGSVLVFVRWYSFCGLFFPFHSSLLLFDLIYLPFHSFCTVYNILYMYNIFRTIHVIFIHFFRF